MLLNYTRIIDYIGNESSDSSPIENVWHKMKGYHQIEVKQQQWWKLRLGGHNCIECMRLLRKVIPHITDWDGEANDKLKLKYILLK